MIEPDGKHICECFGIREILTRNDWKPFIEGNLFFGPDLTRVKIVSKDVERKR